MMMRPTFRSRNCSHLQSEPVFEESAERAFEDLESIELHKKILKAASK